MSTFIEEQVISTLDSFKPHGLEDLDKASLMNRVDTKFIVPVAKLPKIFDAIRDHYTVLEIGGLRCFRYQSVYYDTHSHLFYNMHHSGRLNRHKVRLRRYVDSDIQFLEVKFKNNKKRTIKKRIELDSFHDFQPEDYDNFLREVGLPQNLKLHPCLTSNYQRIAFASEERGERLTVDVNLENEYLSRSNPRKTHLEKLAIVELKQSRIDRTSPFFKVVREMGIRPSGFSKYCMGMTLTQRHNEDIKTNRFKRILKKINRVEPVPN